MIVKIKSLYKKYEEIINYLIVGALTTLVSILSKWLLLFTILSAKDAFQLQIAIIISWILAVSFAYVTNRKYVFKSKSKDIFKEVVSFFSARIVTLLIEMVIMWFFVTFLKLNSNLWTIFWTIVVQFIVIILNYLFSKLFVFKNKK